VRDPIREWAKNVVRAVPAVHIVNTEAVPTFKRRADACIDRAAVLLALEHAEPMTPWVYAGQGDWLRFDPLTSEEITEIVNRLDHEYGKGDLASKYVAAWLDVARLLSTVAVLPALDPEP